MLAGLIKAPNRYSPFRDAERAKHRRDYALGLMLKQGDITAEQHAAAVAEPLRVAPVLNQAKDAPYFVDFVRQELAQAYPVRRPHHRGAAHLHRARHASAAPRGAGRAERPGRAREALPASARRQAHRATASLSDRHPAANRRDQGNDGRPRLPLHAVQPLHAGAAATGLGVQAVHLPHRLRADASRRSAHPADDTDRGRAVRLGVRQPGVEPGQLQEALPGHGQRARGAGVLAQRRDGAAGAADRPAGYPRHGAPHGHQLAACRPTRRSCSAPPR